MLTIRLARIGKKNKPFYRLVISQKKKDLYGNSLEILGSYNPHTKELKINGEKTKYWLSQGAGMSPTVNNLLIEKKVIEGKKLKASKGRKNKKAAAEAKPAAAGPAKPEMPKAEKTVA
jgi:small subunit ribosomal protein S16